MKKRKGKTKKYGEQQFIFPPEFLYFKQKYFFQEQQEDSLNTTKPVNFCHNSET